MIHIIHPSDNVGVALSDIASGAELSGVTAREDIPAGHKIALCDIAEGGDIVKYGFPIGGATQAIRRGEWVHTHNTATHLSGALDYAYAPAEPATATPLAGTFMGYLRGDGRVGVRNEIWILPLVSCVNRAAERIGALSGLPGVYAFPHPYGCSQVGEDLLRTRRVLSAMARHPNAGGALILGLGCENNDMQTFRELLGPVDETRIKFLIAQDADDEIASGIALIREIASVTATDVRTEQPLSKLVLGLKCGGSDGFSGLSANPLLGALSDGVTAAGGTTLMTEVPEMFGAETILMARAANADVFQKTVRMINEYKAYFLRYGEKVSDNPSPGNKDGGLTTLEDKSLGCTQKGGAGAVSDVLQYAEPVRQTGLNLVYGPGNDGCAMTALTAAGAQIILFTTGRGTPMGGPVPTLKISTNTRLYMKKPGWIDYDAGALLSGKAMDTAVSQLLSLVLRTASGDPAKNELRGEREMVIFKDGVVE